MADNAGFLEQLGIPSMDERAILDAQRAKIRQGRPGYAQNYAAGRQARPLLGGAVEAITGLISGKDGGRSLKGLARNFGQGLVTEHDRQVAVAAGITPETLKSRRAIREEIGKEPFKSPEAFETQISMAKKVAVIALRNGDMDTYGKTISALSSLKVQKAEFDKLKSGESRAQEEHERDGIVTAFLNGKPVDGAMGENEDGVAGMWISDGRGGSKFEPWGPDLHRVDTSRGHESLQFQMRNSLQRGEGPELRALVTTNIASHRKFDRVMTNISEFSKEGRAGAVTGKIPAGISVALDTAFRAVKDTVGMFAPGAAVNRDNAAEYKIDENGNARGVKSWMSSVADDPKHEIWDFVTLPPGIQQNSADAQNYRAHLIELAYMAARLREPSNRGLSDKDVESALRSMGESSNPQVIMTRFAEFMGDGLHEAETNLRQYTGGMFPGFSAEEVEQHLVGDSMKELRAIMQASQAKHNYTFDNSGRVKFLEPVDPFQPSPSAGGVQPVNQSGGYNVNTPIIDLSQVSDEEFEARTGL